MEKLDPVWLKTFADLFINLSAGWFGAAFIVPATIKPPKRANLWLLTTNLLFAIFALVIAFELRKWAGV